MAKSVMDVHDVFSTINSTSPRRRVYLYSLVKYSCVDVYPLIVCYIGDRHICNYNIRRAMGARKGLASYCWVSKTTSSFFQVLLTCTNALAQLIPIQTYDAGTLAWVPVPGL